MFIRSVTKQFNYRLLPFQIIIFLIFSICNFCKKDNSLIIENTELAKAFWIGAQDDSTRDDTHLYKDYPTPIFHKEFIDEKIFTQLPYI